MLLASVFAILITSCASSVSSSTEQSLSAAGFVVRTPQNAKQRQLYDDLPAYKVHRGTYDGKTFYAYKNEKQGVAYVGTEQAYQEYQRISIQRRIARDNYAAAEMNRNTAYGWYGSYGPYIGYRPVVIVR